MLIFQDSKSLPVFPSGTHLPDLTVVTPVFKSQTKPIFFVASRGHHADIGGLTPGTFTVIAYSEKLQLCCMIPGSMPSNSTSIFQEGAAFKSFKLVSGNNLQEEKLTELLMEPSKFPGCSGTRALSDNLSDLKAQIAANHKGLNLVIELIDTYGLKVVLAYMQHIQKNAELEVRDLMKKVSSERNTNVLSSFDMMDDGTVISLEVRINPDTGDAIFDFTGTGEEVYGNCNAPESITYSAIIYCLRCLIGHDIPLNHGILSPITVVFPQN